MRSKSCQSNKKSERKRKRDEVSDTETEESPCRSRERRGRLSVKFARQGDQRRKDISVHHVILCILCSSMKWRYYRYLHGDWIRHLVMGIVK